MPSSSKWMEMAYHNNDDNKDNISLIWQKVNILFFQVQPLDPSRPVEEPSSEMVEHYMQGRAADKKDVYEKVLTELSSFTWRKPCKRLQNLFFYQTL